MKEELKTIRDALGEAWEFVDCDTRRSGEIGEYAKRVCKTLKQALDAIDKIERNNK